MTEFRVGEFAVIGRTYEEYLDMFGLDPDDVDGRSVLDCPSGADSFVATAHERGASVVGVDPVYELRGEDLARRCRTDFRAVADQIREKPDLFDWEYYGTAENRIARLKTAHERFLSDYENGRERGRYVPAALPDLPFETDAFSLALSANFLFLYGDRLDYGFHVEAIRELARVATDEVRIFPLAGLDTEPYDRLDDALARLRSDGYGVRIDEVSYEFQQGVDEVLVIAP